MLAQNRLEESQAAAARGDVAAAIEAADDARAAAALGGHRPTCSSRCSRSSRATSAQANRHIDEALERDRSDWSIWLVAARVQTKAGFIRKGRRSLRQAERLNRKSQLFEALRDRTRKPSS